MNQKISTGSYKGVRDFYPEDKFVQQYIFGKMQAAAEKFGYEEYDASILESTDLYRAKSGEELINEQVYTFTDRGGREVTLRPEMTPSLARMIAKGRNELVMPTRWFNIGNHFRYERPQKGRGREFWQLNADIFGVDGLEAEVEIIGLSHELMKSFGAVNDDFEIRVNDRQFVQKVFDESGLDSEQSYKMSKIFDKKNKLTQDVFEEQVGEVLGGDAGNFLNKIQNVETPQSIKDVIEKLNNRGVDNVVFDLFLMRGLDYYTGIVFEVFDMDPANNRSMFGGGRYDNLLDIFGKEKLPAVGFGMGDMTIFEFLQSRDLLPVYKPSADLYLCIFDFKYTDFTDKLAQDLRDQGLNVAVDYSYAKIGKQIKVADKKGILFVICIGEDEVKKDEFVLKNMSSRDGVRLLKSDIVAKIKQ